MSVRALTLCALFTALMVAGAYISLPTPAIPLTFQPFFSVLAGTILGPKLGAASLAAYIFMGLAGVPVFAGFTGGMGKLLTPTFGFILGFLAAAVSSGLVLRRGEVTFQRVAAASVAGIASIYIIGVPYMYAVLTLVTGNDVKATFTAVVLSMLPFLVKDLVLSLSAAGLAARLIPIARKAIRN